MTYATLPHPTAHFGASLREIFSAFKAKIAARRAFNRTVRELSSLTAAQLDDLGLNAGMIHSVAMDVTYGKHRA